MMLTAVKVFKKILLRIYKVVVRSKMGYFVIEHVSSFHRSQIQAVERFDTGFKADFLIPGPIVKFRVDTYNSKEPETLNWIDSMPRGSVFWDIGANVGLYSIYAARNVGATVVAFEPSVFNLEWLARNIYLNHLQSRISVVPVALSDKCGFNTFGMSNTAWGGALSTFGEKFDQNGEDLHVIFEYQTIGLTLRAAYQYFSLPKPTHMKIDVDGLEHFILRGAGDVLGYPQQVLIEINDAFVAQATETSSILKGAGLRLENKFSLGVPNQHNQLWCRLV